MLASRLVAFALVMLTLATITACSGTTGSTPRIAAPVSDQVDRGGGGGGGGGGY